MKPKLEIHWLSPVPTKCDICPNPITDLFYDAAVPIGGPWGCICHSCFISNRCRLGTGFGQKYKLQADGKRLKVEG